MTQALYAHMNNKTIIKKQKPKTKKKKKTRLPELMGHSKGCPKRKVYSHECIY
jgi:hypothetical protein